MHTLRNLISTCHDTSHLKVGCNRCVVFRCTVSFVLCFGHSVFAAAMIGTLVEADDSLLKKAFDKLDVNRDGKA